MTAYKKLEEHFKKIGTLNSIQALISWDNNVMLPKGGASGCAMQMTYLSSETYKLLNDSSLKILVEDASAENLNDLQKSNLEHIKYQYLCNKAVDEKFVKEKTNATLACELNWREARANNDFKSFSQHFKPLLELVQEEASRKGELLGLGSYDALLDGYDKGRRSSEIDVIFSDLEIFLPDFISQVQEKQKTRKIIPLNGDFSEEKQKELGLLCMEALGFDLNRGRLDVSLHPFSTGISSNDVRITTRYDKKSFISGLYGVLHETGHALYEQNLPKDPIFQPVSNHCGMTIHESQSLFVENHIGNSKEFFSWIMSQIIDKFGNHPSLTAENLYNITNKVSPSFIRVDADEVTYPAHVIMRYKLEKALLSGDLPIDELPTAWEEELYRLLKIKPKNFTEGCLQDIHWAWGAIGYFPTYTLGAMFASQLGSTMNKSMNNAELVIKGDLKPIIKWLKEKIHIHGSRYSSNELVINSTGESLNSDIFKQYLQKKYLP